MRVHLTTKLIDQPWQLPLADLPQPKRLGTAAESAGEDPLDPSSPLFALPPALAPGAADFNTGAGIPRWELAIGGELMFLVGLDSTSALLATFFADSSAGHYRSPEISRIRGTLQLT